MDLSEIPDGTFQRHPWEVSRRRFFTRVLRDAGVLQGAPRVLDAGAGDGWFSRQLLGELPAGARVTCFDAHYTPEHLARFNARGGAQTFTSQWPDGCFDLLLLLDVLEHVEGDGAFLQRLVDALVPGATAVISVPAWSRLYGQHDRSLQHHRRYDPGVALALLRSCGLTIERGGGLFHSLLAVRGVTWAHERLFESKAVGEVNHEHELFWGHGPLLAGAILGVLSADNCLSHWFSSRGLHVPGLSWWALCRKS